MLVLRRSVLLVAMYLSKGQVVRLLALWCLIMLGLATPVLYVRVEGWPDGCDEEQSLSS